MWWQISWDSRFTDFEPVVLHFFAKGRKNEGQKKESTMLPQAKAAIL
jgi:hypothetical protein